MDQNGKSNAGVDINLLSPSNITDHNDIFLEDQGGIMEYLPLYKDKFQNRNKVGSSRNRDSSHKHSQTTEQSFT